MRDLDKSLPVLVVFLLVIALGACDRSGGNDSDPPREPAAPAAESPASQSPPPETAAEPASSEALETQAVTVVGRNYCLGCSLKKEQEAAAQCSEYGHRHALSVESATSADDQPLKELVGETVHYLDNDNSAALLEGEDLHDARVQVTGRLFAPERTLEVDEVEVL